MLRAFKSRRGELAEEIFSRQRPRLEGQVGFYAGTAVLFIIFMTAGTFLYSRKRKRG